MKITRTDLEWAFSELAEENHELEWRLKRLMKTNHELTGIVQNLQSEVAILQGQVERRTCQLSDDELNDIAMGGPVTIKEQINEPDDTGTSLPKDETNQVVQL